jgi:hypothetical protein
MPAEATSAFDARSAFAEMSEGFSQIEGPTEKDESQKSQARTLDGNTAPHCEQVLVTG